MITVDQSQYNSTGFRDIMIKAIATAVMKSAEGKNCKTKEFSKPAKRSFLDGLVPPLRKRWAPDLEHPMHALWCVARQFYEVDVFGPDWKLRASPAPENRLAATLSFEVPKVDEFFCGLLLAAIEAFAFVAPEFAALDIDVAKVIEIECRSGMGAK
jgi:hypothetical protein